MTLSHYLKNSLNKIVDILIEDVPLKKDFKLYSFLVPENLIDELEVGKRVFVPFGRGNKLKKGIIVKIWEGEGKDLKEIFGFVSKYKIIDENGLRVLFKLKEKYFIPVIVLLKKVIPLGKSKKGEEYVTIKDDYENKVKSREKRKIELINFILENGGTIKLSTLKKFFSKSLIKSLLDKGIIEKTYIFQKERKIVSKDFNEIKIKEFKEVQIPDKLVIYGSNYFERWSYYIKLFEHLIKSGKGAKIIFPERIYVEDFYNQLPDEIKKYSVMITGEIGKRIREEIFKGINDGLIKLIVGTTISLLLPLDEELLIVDMEDRFKSVEELLNFNINEIALTYIEGSNKKLIIGAFFPSLNLYVNSKRKNFEIKKERLNLKNIRIFYNREDLLITPEIKNIIHKNKNKKIFIFYPRKGYFSFLSCDDCGYVEKCPKCKVPLTYFLEKNRLICKICGYEKNLFDICPECGGISMKLSSPGVERVKERVKKIFKDRLVYQLDESIVEKSKKRREEIEKEFLLNGDILVGTQMILPLLRKVKDFIFIFLNIDFMLNFPEYDSFENVYYLILRVIEESLVNNGKIFIQTRFPKNIIFKSINEKNPPLFLKEELKRRKESKFPPYTKYIIIENIDSSYLKSFKEISLNEDEIYYDDNKIRIKTKEVNRFKEIFDKIKNESRIIVKEF